ncbi:hypothetical protein IWX50DRAFT_198051 [Phyllosticta citricarpa]
MVLYVFTIQEQNSHPRVYERLFDAGKKCQGQISEISIPGSLAERYGVVLEELRLEILRYNSYLASREQVIPSSGTLDPAENQDVAAGETRTSAANGQFVGGNKNSNHNADIGALAQLQNNQFSPLEGSTSDIAEFPDWGQFDSLVSSQWTSILPASMLKTDLLCSSAVGHWRTG